MERHQTIWIYNREGKRTGATPEDAKQMIESEDYSALYPRGDAEAEKKEYERLVSQLPELPAEIKEQRQRGLKDAKERHTASGRE